MRVSERETQQIDSGDWLQSSRPRPSVTHSYIRASLSWFVQQVKHENDIYLASHARDENIILDSLVSFEQKSSIGLDVEFGHVTCGVRI